MNFHLKTITEQVIQTEDIKELFEMLDSDNDGRLGIDEFCFSKMLNP